MPLKDVCNRNVVCISPDASALNAALIMKEKHVGTLVVVKHPEHPKDPLGVVTDRDLVLKVLAQKLCPEETKVSQVMVLEPRIARDTDGLLEATEMMESSGVRRLPVVDSSGNLKGIVAADDLYELLTTELANLSRIGSRQVHMESHGFSRQ